MKSEPGYNRPNYPANRSPLKAIRWFCLDCISGSSKNVESCSDRGCALFPFRFGCSPSAARKRGRDV
jgi:hypothetical protein